MARQPLALVLDQVRRLIGPRSSDDRADAQLLERFSVHGDEAAYEALVQRHGPMVLGVCRRILRNHQDAEDAFQATFLVLARKARSIRRRGVVGSWLYQVAYRAALEARARAVRRPEHDTQAMTMRTTETPTDADWQELCNVLDQELHALPEKHRTPLVLCYLEGKTHEEAAGQMGLPRGSMAKRLTAARERLRERLQARGVAISTAGLGTLLTAHTAAVPASLLHATVKAGPLFASGKAAVTGAASARVIDLSEGVLHAMFLGKMKLAVVGVLVVGVLGLGTGWVASRSERSLSEAPTCNALALDRLLVGRGGCCIEIKKELFRLFPENNFPLRASIGPVMSFESAGRIAKDPKQQPAVVNRAHGPLQQPRRISVDRCDRVDAVCVLRDVVCQGF
jgi:RNA polymerase sigma factor (sigma-70 family)